MDSKTFILFLLSRDLGHTHFQGKIFVRPLGIPDAYQICSL